MTQTYSAVLVPVPEAERVVSRYRARLDGAAALGVPAHVTVLYPFVPPAAITAATLEELAGGGVGGRVRLPVPGHRVVRVRRAVAGRVWLMTGGAAPVSWRTVAEFPLRP
jgi:hypothetical protein